MHMQPKVPKGPELQSPAEIEFSLIHPELASCPSPCDFYFPFLGLLEIISQGDYCSQILTLGSYLREPKIRHWLINLSSHYHLLE